MSEKDVKELLSRYSLGQVTAAEKAIVERWYLDNHALDDRIKNIDLEHEQQKSLKALLSDIRPVRTFSLWPRIAAAVVVVLCAGIGYSVYLGQTTEGFRLARMFKNDVSPGSNKAILTLADGKKISLTDAGNGELARESGVVIRKTADGKLIYEVNGKAKSETNERNTIETPRGGQYQVILPDGTRVWLNAASSLTYPASFNGADERKVELMGEAYFEVAKMTFKMKVRDDKSAKEHMPFIVVSKGQEVKVLGTHFNINSYADEGKTRTTLLEGSVQVVLSGNAERLNRKKAEGVVLKPGQQSLLQAELLNVSHVNTEDVVAWKNGYFLFDKTDIKTVMRQLSRWYEIDVKYEDKVPDVLYTGMIPRQNNISAVLQMLTRTGKTEFKITGKTITVLE